MSGPIVRKYGFPNFEKIFGERELQHGVEDDAASTPGAEAPAPPPARKPKAAKKSAEAVEKTKKKKG